MKASLVSAKANLRQQIRVRLDAITHEHRVLASREVCSHLRREAIWQSASSVLCFAPLPDEPDIWPLVEECLAAGKTVGLPRFSAERSSYVACQVRDLTQDIRAGEYQIREPKESCAEFPVARFDLILVPGVAFDSSGHRLGRGKGYYDQMLAGVPRGKLCGVAFADQWVADIPTEKHDVTMQFVVTPSAFFPCEG